jgi:N6-L-threonylcarbamoyladenine synthase
VLVAKSLRALKSTGLARLVVAGGVGANAELRRQLDAAARAAAGACTTRAGAVHRQRRDDRAGRGDAAAGRPGRASTGYAFDVRPRWPLDRIDDPRPSRHG